MPETNSQKALANWVAPTTHQGDFHNLSATTRSQRSYFKDHDDTLSSNMFASKFPVTNNKRKCNTRAMVIAFIVVILIIIIAAIAIGVTFTTIKSQQNTSETVTGNDNQNSLSTTAVVSSVRIGSQSGPPCTSYTTINDPSRNVNQTGLYGSCDVGPLFNASNGGSWIRFVGTGGTMIPLVPPSVTQCGGFLAGWINGTLPTTLGRTTNAWACFTNSHTSFAFRVNVSITQCSGFYVYFLSPAPACNGRYCTV